MAVAGGADDVSDVIKGVAAENFLAKYRAILKDQKDRGYTVKGMGTTRVKPTPGLVLDDYDARLTLKVCEDRTQTTWTENKKTEAGTLVQGQVYARIQEGRVVLVEIVSSDVDRCDF
ncbi:hypothetical protein CGZ98_03155 [Enemella evansiae]|nr:hypothetical protein CGZ98_03155 [Enemella evansiae]